MKKVVIALGGNAILTDNPSAKSQQAAVNETAKKIKRFIENSNENLQIIIVHGNGPQVGNLLLQQIESDSKMNPAMPLDTDVAMTQGEIGYWLQNALGNQGEEVVTVVTRALVKSDDPAFENPTKPIGPFYKNQDEIIKLHPDWNFMEDSGRGFRRVVPSPKPIKIIENQQINKLIDSGNLVIAGGGGGVPVIEKNNQLSGVEAVIDKDFTAAKIAEAVSADQLLILTAVEQVAINFNKPNQENLNTVDINKLQEYLKQNQFGKGSMEPKIEASIEFVKKTGHRAVITSLDNVADFSTNGRFTEIKS